LAHGKGEEEVFTAREIAAAIGRLKFVKSSWWRWNQTRDVESVEQWRNSLANSSVSSCVEVW